MNTSASPRSSFIILWILCIIGSLAVFPYVQHLGLLPTTPSVEKVIALNVIQAALLFGFICWASYKILPRTDLHPFPYLDKENFFKRLLGPALLAGAVVGVAIFLLDKIVFNGSLFIGAHPPLWTGALASFYGAVNEEVLLRLFLFTLIYFLIGKCVQIQGSNRNTILWCVNIGVALLFGVGHLPAAYKIGVPSTFDIFRILSLNGLAGLVFGWLYWTRGIWTAILAHFVTDLVIHVFLI